MLIFFLAFSLTSSLARWWSQSLDSSDLLPISPVQEIRESLSSLPTNYCLWWYRFYKLCLYSRKDAGVSFHLRCWVSCHFPYFWDSCEASFFRDLLSVGSTFSLNIHAWMALHWCSLSRINKETISLAMSAAAADVFFPSSFIVGSIIILLSFFGSLLMFVENCFVWSCFTMVWVDSPSEAVKDFILILPITLCRSILWRWYTFRVLPTFNSSFGASFIISIVWRLISDGSN